MARPREFDIDEALDAALGLFWRKGFEATSMADLTAAMGIQKGSLYQAFGDKKSLFLRALDRYTAGGREGLKEMVESQAPIEVLRSWIGMACGKGASEDGAPRGCFCVNVTTELAPHDEDVAARLDEHWSGVRELLAKVVKDGQTAGELRANLNPDRTAQSLVAFVAGTQVLARQGPAGTPCGEVVDDWLAMLRA